MNLLENQKKAWNEHFSKVILEYPDEEVIRFLNGYKKRNGTGKMLDLGCGTGRHTVAALKLGYEVTAVDFVQHCIDVTKSRVESIDKEAIYILNKDTDIDVKSEDTDVIVAWGVFFCNWKEKIVEFLKEANRILKSDGEIFCDFRTQRDDMYSHSENYGNFIEENTLLIQENESAPGRYLYFTTKDDLEKMVNAAGLEISNIELYEFTQRNMTKLNSWYHVILKKSK